MKAVLGIESGRKSASLSYMPQLDGLRAICIIGTILNHSVGVPWFIKGYVGVDVFFALSGFLITSLLVTDVKRDRWCLKCFFIRRFFRIVPLCYIVFLLYAGAAVVVHQLRIQDDVYSQMLVAWPYVLSFLGEYYPREAGTFYGHVWTLGIEEKYYLVWPILFFVLLRVRNELRIISVFGLFAVAFFLPNLEFRGYGGLAFGSLLALILQDRGSALARVIQWPATWMYLGLVAIAYSTVMLMGGTRWNIAIAVASGLLIVKLVTSESVTRNFLAFPALAFAGKHTYSIYLVHVLIANGVAFGLRAAELTAPWWLFFLMTYVVSFSVAHVLKLTIEDPLIKLGKGLSERTKQARTPSLASAG